MATQTVSFLTSIKLKHVKLCYHYLMSNILTLSLLSLIAATIVNLEDLHTLYLSFHYNLFAVIIFMGAVVIGSTLYIMTRPRPIYLVDYSCYRPPENLQVPFEKFMNHSKLTGDFTESAFEFQRKILERSGVGEETYLPPAMHCIPPVQSMATARQEAEDVMFGVLDNLFKATNVKPKDIGILVVNCSLFNPTPSLSAMIVNKYKLRGSIRSFNLGGMGCSAGVIAVDLYTENITQNWNFGNCV